MLNLSIKNMKTLYLLRHAKSSKDINGIADIDRPLMVEGTENTKLVARKLNKSNIHIMHMVSSPAVRAFDTAKLFGAEFGIPKDDILIYHELYKPDIPAFEDCIFSLPDEWDHVVIVSHNPGISDFASSLLKKDYDMATASIIAASFDIDKWINLYIGVPKFKFYLKPVDIK